MSQGMRTGGQAMRLLLSAAFIVLATTAEAQGSDWVVVCDDTDHNPVMVDGTSFTFEGTDKVWFWEKIAYRNGTTELSRMRIDCPQNSWALITSQMRNKHGDVIKHFDMPNVIPRAIPPDSLIQQVRYVVCGEKNLHDMPPGFMEPPHN